MRRQWVLAAVAAMALGVAGQATAWAESPHSPNMSLLSNWHSPTGDYQGSDIAFWGNRILLAFRLGSGDVKDTLNAALVLQQVVVGIGIIGFVMLVAVIARVERTASARARGLAAAAA